MKFRGVNTLRINKETVKKALADSFSKDLIGNELSAIDVKYHENGDISLTFEPCADAERRRVQAINPAPDAAAPMAVMPMAGIVSR
jgi:hypothetical protein